MRNWFSEAKKQEDEKEITHVFVDDLNSLILNNEKLREEVASFTAPNSRHQMMIDEIFHRLRERADIIERVKTIVFMRLNTAMDHRDHRAEKIYREIQEAMR